MANRKQRLLVICLTGACLLLLVFLGSHVNLGSPRKAAWSRWLGGRGRRRVSACLWV